MSSLIVSNVTFLCYFEAISSELWSDEMLYLVLNIHASSPNFRIRDSDTLVTCFLSVTFSGQIIYIYMRLAKALL